MSKSKSYSSKYKSVLVSTTNIKAISDRLNQAKEKVIDRLVYTLNYIGEQCVTIARRDHEGNWTDVTGNLRSSIAYVVLVNGEPAGNPKQQFEQHKGKTGDGAAGVAQAKRLLNELQGKYNRGVVLIVVAGMKYAAYVESVRHKVVLSGAQLESEQLVKQLLSSLLK